MTLHPVSICGWIFGGMIGSMYAIGVWMNLSIIIKFNRMRRAETRIEWYEQNDDSKARGMIIANFLALAFVVYCCLFAGGSHGFR